MKFDKTLFNNFVMALKQLVTWPIAVESKGDVSKSFNWFPVAGTFLGILPFFIIQFIVWLLGENLAIASILSAGFFAFYLYFINQGRNVNSLLKASTFLSDSVTENAKNELTNHLGQQLNTIVMIFLFFSKLVTVGMLVYHGLHKWLILVPLFSSGCLSMFFVNVRYEEQPEKKLERYTPWLLSLLIASIVFGVSGFATGAVIWFLSQLAYDFVKKQSGSAIQDMVYGSCELAECLTILGGLFLLFL